MEKPKIAILTGRKARRELEEIVESLKEKGVEVSLVVLPVEVASLTPLELIEQYARRLEREYDIIIAPGTIPYEPSQLKRASSKLVKGPENPQALRLLSSLEPDKILESLEKGILRLEPDVYKLLEELAKKHEEKPGIEVCGVKTPLRPPPFIVVAEVFAKNSANTLEEAERLASKALELYSRGADIIVVGFDPTWAKTEALEVVRRVKESIRAPIGVDSPNKKLVVEAVSREEACLALSAWRGDILLDMLPRETPIVIIPGEPGKKPKSIPDRIKELKKGVEEAEKRGLTPIADPLVDPPLMGLGESIVAYYYASREIREAPLLAGIANAYELLDADTHGAIALLAVLFGELGATILLVGEESRKAYMSVTETSIAATMTSIALMQKTLPKNLGIDLLSVKEKKKLAPTPLPRKPSIILDVKSLANWYGYRQDLLGTHLIAVDEEKQLLRDTYIGRKGTIELRAKNAIEAYKAIAYLGLASEPTHYSFLGYELCRAELALKLKRSYQMEKPVINPPWEKPYYSARAKKPRKPKDN